MANARRPFYLVVFWTLRPWCRPAPSGGAKAPPDAQKRLPESMLGPLWPPQTQMLGLCSSPRVLWVFVTCSIYFRAAAALNSLVLCSVREKRANGLRSTKTMFSHEFSMLAAGKGACHASKKIAKFKANTLTKKCSKIVGLVSFGSLYNFMAMQQLVLKPL